MRKFIKNNADSLAAVVTSTASVGLSYFASMLYSWVETFFEESEPSAKRIVGILFFIMAFFVFLLSVFILHKISRWILNTIWPERTYDSITQHAFIKLKSMLSLRQEQFQDTPDSSIISVKRYILSLHHNMQLAVNACYDFFESAYSATGQLVDDIKFEVTFMTESYRDRQITIAYSCNKEHRTPRSMLCRESRPDIYKNTETAKIYKAYQEEKNPQIQIIPDTSKEAGYAEVYTRQKERIKSTIILPVVSHRNELLGTIVVHCNKADFFKREKQKFWEEILEIFSVDLGYQKLKLDAVMQLQNEENNFLPF